MFEIVARLYSYLTDLGDIINCLKLWHDYIHN